MFYQGTIFGTNGTPSIFDAMSKNIQKFSLGLVHYFYSMWFINVQKLRLWYQCE
jgi:hypothetical protein